MASGFEASSPTSPIRHPVMDVCILKMVDPAHYVMAKMSEEYSACFFEMEHKMNKYCQEVLSPAMHPVQMSKGMLVIVYCSQRNKWFRSIIESLLETLHGLAVRAYLVDYGETINVSSANIRPIGLWKDFPFRAFHFELIGLVPLTKCFSLDEHLTSKNVPAENWDSASLNFVTETLKYQCKHSLKVKVYGTDDNGTLFGLLLYYDDVGKEVILNDTLVKQEYASLSREKAEKALNIKPLSEIYESTNTTVGDMPEEKNTFLLPESIAALLAISEKEVKERAARNAELEELQNFALEKLNEEKIFDSPCLHDLSKTITKSIPLKSSAECQALMTQVQGSDTSGTSSPLPPLPIKTYSSSSLSDTSVPHHSNHSRPPTRSSLKSRSSISSHCEQSETQHQLSSDNVDLNHCAHYVSAMPMQPISSPTFSRMRTEERKEARLSLLPSYHPKSSQNRPSRSDASCSSSLLTSDDDTNQEGARLKQPCPKLHDSQQDKASSAGIHCTSASLLQRLSKKKSPQDLYSGYSSDCLRSSDTEPQGEQLSRLPVKELLAYMSRSSSSQSLDQPQPELSRKGTSQPSASFQMSSRSSSAASGHMEEDQEMPKYLPVYKHSSSSPKLASNFPSSCSLKQYQESNQQNTASLPSRVPSILKKLITESSSKSSEVTSSFPATLRKLRSGSSSLKGLASGGSDDDKLSVAKLCVSESLRELSTVTASNTTDVPQNQSINFSVERIERKDNVQKASKGTPSCSSLRKLFSTSRNLTSQRVPIQNISPAPQNSAFQESVFNNNVSSTECHENHSVSTDFLSDTGWMVSKDQNVALQLKDEAFTPNSKSSLRLLRNFHGDRAGSAKPERPSRDTELLKALKKCNQNKCFLQPLSSSSPLGYPEMQALPSESTRKPKVSYDKPMDSVTMNPEPIGESLPVRISAYLDVCSEPTVPSVSPALFCGEEDTSDQEGGESSANDNVDTNGGSKQDFRADLGKRYIQTTPPKQERLPGIDFRNLSPSFKPVKNDVYDMDYVTRNLGNINTGGFLLPVLCYGSHIPAPTNSINDAPLNTRLKLWLKEIKFNGPSTIQVVAWPAVLRGRSTVIVAPRHSGKTLSYLVPLLSDLEEPNKQAHLPQGKTPRALILCSSWKGAQIVYEHCMVLLGEHRAINVLVMFGGSEKNQMLEVVNGNDILITTPWCMKRILEHWRATVRVMHRLHYVILDDGDALLDKYPKEIQDILQEFGTTIRNSDRDIVTSQFVVCSTTWTPRIESFARCYMANPLVFIFSFFEAAVYARVPVSAHVYSPEAKLSALSKLLVSCRRKRVVICATSAAKVEEVKELLSAEFVFHMVAHENLAHYNLKAVAQEWKSMADSPVMLVISDHVLFELNIRDATCLIHYDIPEESRWTFGKRFVCISEHFPDVLSMAKGSVITSPCECHILVTPECKRQALRLIDLVKRTNSGLSPDLRSLAEVYRKELDNGKIELCEQLKAYGKCSNENYCTKRHKVHAILDKPRLPWNGLVRVLITHVVSASNYWVRIQDHKETEIDKWVPAYLQYDQLEQTLNDYFADGQNKKCPNTVAQGEIYAIEKSGAYHRVQIVKVYQNYGTSVMEKVFVHYVDKGHTGIVRRLDLLIVPKDVEVVPMQAIQLYLCSVVPVDDEESWTNLASSFVDEHIGGRILVGKVALCLGSTLWMDPLVVQKKLESSRTYVNIFNVKKQLIENGYAQLNPTHVTSLQNLCKGVIDVPPRPVTSSISMLHNQSQAFLDMENKQEVLVVVVLSVDQFYVQRDEFFNQREELEMEINESFSKGELRLVKEPVEGMLCLAPLTEEDVLYRAAIRNFDTASNTATVFFVDYGDMETVNVNRIYEILPRFLSLPLQAIECSLANIIPADGDVWSQDAIDALLDLTRTSNNDLLTMDLEVVCKVVSQAAPRNKYKVNLYLPRNDGERIDVARELFRKELAISEQQMKMENNLSEDDTGKGSSTSEVFIDDGGGDMDDECGRAFIEDIVRNLQCQQEPQEFSDDYVEEVEEPKIKVVETKEIILNEESLLELKSDEHVWKEGHGCNAVCQTLLRETPSVSRQCSEGNTCHQIAAAESALPGLSREKTIQSLLKAFLRSKHQQSNPATPQLTAPSASDTENKSEDDLDEGLTPQIRWWQKKKLVSISMNVVAVKDCIVRFKPRHLIFQTTAGGQVYSLNEELYGEICPETCRHTIKPSCVLITLEKRNRNEKWPHLFPGKRKAAHVKPDFDHISTSSSESEEEHPSKTVNLGIKKLPSREQVVLPHEPFAEYSDDESDDDESGPDHFSLKSCMR